MQMSLSREKAELRSIIRQKERELSPEYRERSDRAIAEAVLIRADYRRANTLFAFVGTCREIDTRPILADALAQGKRLAVPLCVGEGRMEARLITSLSQLRPGAYGILEPPEGAPLILREELDLSLVPCLTCDREGNRLGQGGGYYDRYFQRGTDNCLLLCRRELLTSRIPRQEHDLIFPQVVTD